MSDCGESDVSTMRKLLTEPTFDLSLVHGRLHRAAVAKHDRPLGLRIKYDFGGTKLAIKHVEAEGSAVGSIVAVNGVAGGSGELLAHLRDSERPELKISRCEVS